MIQCCFDGLPEGNGGDCRCHHAQSVELCYSELMYTKLIHTKKKLLLWEFSPEGRSLSLGRSPQINNRLRLLKHLLTGRLSNL